MDQAVVITGLGVSTAVGRDAAELWNHVVLGGPPPAQAIESAPFSQSQEALKMALSATIEALENARLYDANSIDGRSMRQRILGVIPKRFGMTISGSKPLFEPEGSVLPPDGVNDALCREFGVEGERRNVVAACATGAYSVALGASWIEQGLCDVVLAGSVEPPVHPLIEAGFKQMGVVTPDVWMRPFDRHRSGFVLGSGAGVVILESREHALARGARIIARLSGWGWGTDPHSAVAFNSNGAHIASVISQALRRAKLSPEQIAHLNAHGTATPLNDWIETQALIKAFGRQSQHLMISGTKSSTGHLLGAAGSVELVLTLLALKNQFIPPTAHLEEPDPECPLDYTPGRGHHATFDHAMSLSFGFGGPIGALVVSRE
jgi:3-oxoacyl-(acyl-carrier-protein) synthase